MRKNPLAEVFGFPIGNNSRAARRCRENRLCPFNNIVPNCTKDKANDPLGVCSILDQDEVAVTCPVRFHEDWVIAADAASFFFGDRYKWTTLTEVRLKDAFGKAAGNIDIVLVAYNDKGQLVDYGALEIQSVYISGNVRKPFEQFMDNPQAFKKINWTNYRNYPNPDYLSSSRKRLAPQLIFKGGILNKWRRKMAVSLNQGFFKRLPRLTTVDKSDAEVAWFIYDLIYNKKHGKYRLECINVLYTKFQSALNQISFSEAGDENDFIKELQGKLNEKLDHESEHHVSTLAELF